LQLGYKKSDSLNQMEIEEDFCALLILFEVCQQMNE